LLQLSKLEDLDIQLIDGDRGENYPSRDEFYENEYCLFLDANNITSNGFDFSSTHFITKEKDTKLRNGKLQRNDIVIMTRGSVGNIALYDNSIKFPNIRINSGMLIIRCGKLINPLNVYYQFKSPIVIKQINDFMSGSVQKQLPVSILKEIKIFTCSKNNANFLKLIDGKIALNNKTNTELENMAKTIYDYWFTQFDFPDKNGHPYKTSGGQMVYNETLKREIPAGWEVGKLGFYLENFGDGIHGTPEYDDSGEYYFINGNNLGNKLISFTSNPLRVNDEEYKKIQRPLNENTILLSINGTLGSISFYNGEKIAIGKSACFLNIKEKEVKPFIYQILCSEKFQKYMYTVASGSTIKNFAPKQAADFDIPIPPKDLLEQFYNTTYSYLENQIKNEKENKELTKLRDYLLPLLMNGQIEVK